MQKFSQLNGSKICNKKSSLVFGRIVLIQVILAEKLQNFYFWCKMIHDMAAICCVKF